MVAFIRISFLTLLVVVTALGLEEDDSGGESVSSELLGSKRRRFKNLFEPTFFYIIGHAGGDPENACENTMESTRSGLEQGMNSVEIDLSMSGDEVIFLWHDPTPNNEWTLARRHNVIRNGKCQPQFDTEVDAKFMTFERIQQVFQRNYILNWN